MAISVKSANGSYFSVSDFKTRPILDRIPQFPLTGVCRGADGLPEASLGLEIGTTFGGKTLFAPPGIVGSPFCGKSSWVKKGSSSSGMAAGFSSNGCSGTSSVWSLLGLDGGMGEE